MTTTNGVDYSHLPELHRKIMEVVSKVDHDDGMHVAALSKACGTAEGPDVMEAIETLMTEGLLFSTIDDLVGARVKLTSSMSRRRRGSSVLRYFDLSIFQYFDISQARLDYTC